MSDTAAQPSTPEAPTGAPTSEQAVTQSGQTRVAPIPEKRTKDSGETGTQAKADQRGERKSERPSLPGVIPRAGGLAADGEERLLPPRGADGRFRAGEDNEGDDDDSEFERELRGIYADDDVPKPAVKPAPAATPEVRPALPVDPASKVKFMGEDLTLPEVEQKHRSLQGMFSHLQTEKRTLTEERDYGYRASNAWQSKAESLERELEQYRGGKQPTAAQPGAAVVQPQSQGGIPSRDDILNSIDAKGFEEIVVTHGFPMAAKYLTAQIWDAISTKLVPAIRQEYQPGVQAYQESTEHQAARQQADQVIQSLAYAKNMRGEDAFPEVKDGATLRVIGELWRNAGHDPQILLSSPAGLMAGIAFYRMSVGLPTEVPAASNQTGGGVVQVPTPAPGPAAMLPADVRGVAHGNGSGERLSDEARNIIAGMDRVALVDPVLGFARRRPSARS